MRTGTIILQSLLLTTLLTAPAAAQVRPTSQAPTPFAADLILAEATAGLFLGFGLSVGLARIGSAVLGPRGGESPGLGGAVAGFAAGLTLGASLGVHLVARGHGLPARYAEAAGGALAGVLLLPVMPIDIDYPSAWVMIYAVPTALAMLGSAVGSWSRLCPVVQPAENGVRAGLAIRF